MTANPHKKINSKLFSWAFERHRDFELQTFHDWSGVETVGDLPNDNLIYSTLDHYQQVADFFVETTVSMALEISQSPEAFVVFIKNVDLFLDYCESTLSHITVLTTESEIVQVFSDAKLSTFRRRIERLADSHRGRFNGGMQAENGNGRAIKANLGRKPKYNWADATSVVWGKIHWGELRVHQQKDIEEALISYLTVGDQAPNAETVRPFARYIMRDYEIDPKDKN